MLTKVSCYIVIFLHVSIAEFRKSFCLVGQQHNMMYLQLGGGGRANVILELKILYHDIGAIFSILCDITTPTRHPLMENSVWDINLVGAVMSCMTLIY